MDKQKKGKSDNISLASGGRDVIKDSVSGKFLFESKIFPSDMICRFTPDTRLYFVNEAYCKEFNKPQSELLGKRFLDFIPSELHDDIIQHLTNLTTTLKPIIYDHRVIKPDGEVRWQRWLDKPLLDKNGMIVGFQSIGRDITKEKSLEEALRNSEEILKFFTRSNADGIVIVNTLKQILLSNISTSIESLFTNKVLRNGEDFVRFLKDKKLALMFEALLDKGLAEKREYGLTYKEDSVLNRFKVKICPVLNSNNDVIALGIVFQSASSENNMSEPEENSSVRDEVEYLSSLLAHEIKSPLASIRLNIDFINDHKNNLSGNVQKSLSIINKEISRLESLTKDFLAYSSNNQKFSEFSIKELLDEIHATAELALNSNNITLQKEIQDKMIQGDRTKIKSLFIELIENSLEALENNGSIKIWTESENQRALKIYFWDNGRGVPDKLNIFKPFFTTKESGSGLGLILARRIARFHAGDIQLIYSEPGNTLFEIILPINPAGELG